MHLKLQLMYRNKLERNLLCTTLIMKYINELADQYVELDELLTYCLRSETKNKAVQRKISQHS